MPGRLCKGVPVDTSKLRESKAYCEGRRAAVLGQELSTNPHPSMTPDSAAWVRGHVSYNNGQGNPLPRDCCADPAFEGGSCTSDITFERLNGVVQGPFDFGAGYNEYYIQVDFTGQVTATCDDGMVLTIAAAEVPKADWTLFASNEFQASLSWNVVYGNILEDFAWDGTTDCLVDGESCRIPAFNTGGAGPG